MSTDQPLVVDVLPELANELRTDLASRDATKLLVQLDDLRIVERCPCTSTFCGSFRTADKPVEGAVARNTTLNCDVGQGMVNLDVIDDQIVFVEMLDRPDDRERLHAAVATNG